MTTMMMMSVSRLLVELSEVSRTFLKFWMSHERRLDQCLQLRQFEEKFKTVSIHLTIVHQLHNHCNKKLCVCSSDSLSLSFSLCLCLWAVSRASSIPWHGIFMQRRGIRRFCRICCLPQKTGNCPFLLHLYLIQFFGGLLFIFAFYKRIKASSCKLTFMIIMSIVTWTFIINGLM